MKEREGQGSAVGGDEGTPAVQAARDYRSLVRRLLPLPLVAAALVQPAASFLGRFDWRVDLLSHFQGPALVATVLSGLVLVRRYPRVAVALAVLAVYQAEPLLRYQGRNPVVADPHSEARLRVLTANVLSENDQYPALAALIRKERPDVVGLIEVSADWIEALSEVRSEYPHRLEAPDGGEGLALWFRAPPRTIDPPQQPLPEGWPYLHATFDFAGKVRNFWLIHPASPFERKGRPELEALAARIASADGSRIVTGDMNCSEGSSLFGEFLKEAGVRDSRYGFGREASWPVWSYYRIAIDHTFITADLAVVNRRVGPPIGSDHLPLIFELAPAAGSAVAASAASSSR